MSEKTLVAFPDYLNEAKKFRNDNLIREIETANNKRTNKWYAEANKKDRTKSSTMETSNIERFGLV